MMNEKLSEERTTRCLAVVEKAIFRDPLSCAKRIDALFREKTPNLPVAMALSRKNLDEYRTSLGPTQGRQIAAALLLVKGQNDILAGYHLLRSGYNTRVIYFIRLALESICQSVLVFLSDNYFNKFKMDRTRADKSIQNVQKKLPLHGFDDNSNRYFKWLCSRKDLMNLYSHSTAQATRGDHIGFTPTFGPSYAVEKGQDYRAIETEYCEMSTLIGNLARWMKDHA